MKKFTTKNGIYSALLEANSFLKSNPAEEHIILERCNGSSIILTRRDVEVGQAFKSDLNLIVYMTIKLLENSDVSPTASAQSIEDALAEYCYFRAKAH